MDETSQKTSVKGSITNAPPPNRSHSRSSHAAILSLEPCALSLAPLPRALCLAPREAAALAPLRRERDVVVAGEPGAFHHVDHRLVRGGGIGADGDDGL